jgi:transcriptional regulator with XRE-family HTH domain
MAQMDADDERLGELFRRLRQRAGITQEALASATSIPVQDIHKLETGRIAEIQFERVRRLFARLEARARLSVWWHGAAADRLLDERHAALGECAARVLARSAWQTPMEVTFSEYGERGSIDIFGHRTDLKAVAVCEVKSAFGSLEEMNRTLDAKVRLAPKLCRDYFGWTPVHVGRLLIVPDLSTIRRVVNAHRQTMGAIYPARSREVRAWLRHPDRDLSGIWFLSDPRSMRTDHEPAA